MTKLQTWMTANGVKDRTVAKAVKLSRVQVSRIRRGKAGASVKAAMRLQELTGLRWHHFMLVPPVGFKRRRARK